MTQINQYSTEITPLSNPLNDDDLFDIDKLIEPDLMEYESQKMSWGTLKTFIAQAPTQNWGNTDLNVTGNRIHNANNNTISELFLNSRIFAMDDADGTGNAFKIERVGVNPPQYGEDYFIMQNGNGGYFKYYDNGSAAFYGGDTQNFFVGDDTGLGTPFGPQSNRNFLATFSSEDRKTVFTDVVIPPESIIPLGSDPADSVAWFRSTSKGVLFPNLTDAQRATIPTPRLGLVIYNTTINRLQVYNGVGATGWQNL